MNKQINTKNFIKNLERAALYLRLSDEDCDKLTKEQISESIKNQEIMLRNYAKEQNWEIVGVYSDEDYSGSDRDRPNFNKMINECEKGNVDIVFVKSQARFARDIELIDKYVHNKFHEWNVRFITHLEKIDNTRRETKKTSQITAMTDEWMLEDTSYNIRQTFYSKRCEGQFTGSFAPYGYMRDPENKNHLLIDPIPALVVERIFIEYSKGYGLQKIANDLTRDNILSPLEYKLMNNSKLKIPLIKNYCNYSHISKAGTYIIKNHFYNNQYQILKNLVTIDLITTDDKTFNGKVSVKINKYKDDKTRIFYSTKSYEELNIKLNDDNRLIFNTSVINDNFIKVKQNDEIPSDVSCIATLTEILDRTHEISYEYEVTLSENRNHDKFYFKTFASSDNTNTHLIFDYNIRNKHKWSTRTVKKILRDEVYIGNLVQFKTTYVSYKNHKVIYNDEEKRVRKDNTHEPIIDKELWYSSQERLNNRKKCCKIGTAQILANKVYCANCGKVFCKCGKNDENGMAYLCCKDKNTKWSNCDNNKYIKEVELQEYLLDKINNLLKNFYKEDMQIKINNNMVENDLFKDKMKNLKNEQININKELDNKSSYFQDLYEDKKKGLLDEDEYMTLRKKYKDDCDKLKSRSLIIDKDLLATFSKQEKLKNKKSLFKKYKQISNLSIEIINDFVNKIEIGTIDAKNNTRKIKIIWNFTI